MATVKAFIRSSAQDKPVKVRIRLSAGRGETYYGVTSITVLPSWWSPEKEELKPRIAITGDQSKDDINALIRDAKDRVLRQFLSSKGALPPDWINLFLAGGSTQGNNADKDTGFFEIWDKYYEEVKVSEGRRRHVKVIIGDLKRFSEYSKQTFTITSFDQVADFELFLKSEHLTYKLYPEIYTDAKGKISKIAPRGQNTINAKLKLLRAFFTWARKNKFTKHNPFEFYGFAPDVYADPLPILPEEVDHLMAARDLTPVLEKTRDLFCLQCYTGCRISDYMSLRRENLDGDILTYIPQKTIKDNPVTVYVPLSDKALGIVRKYDFPDGYIAPRMNLNGKDGYNKQIKKLFEKAGLVRPVAVIDTITRKPEMRRLCDVVTSHTARKTFINSNYLETQDPNLISKMSGHARGSKAFSRYHGIDVDLLRKQIKKAFG